MATVGTLFPSTNPDAVAGAANSSKQNSPAASDPLANQGTFLQLLVAQLKNQDPTQPVDGTTFVTQLAQFSDLEQNLGSRQDLDALSEKYLVTTAPPSDGGGSNAGAATSGSPTTSNVNSSSNSQHP